MTTTAPERTQQPTSTPSRGVRRTLEDIDGNCRAIRLPIACNGGSHELVRAFGDGSVGPLVVAIALVLALLVALARRVRRVAPA